MSAERPRAHLSDFGEWFLRPDGWWLMNPAVDVRALATAMLAAEARLATITAIPETDGRVRLAYHFDLLGVLHTVVVTAVGAAPSIADIYPGADWIEREIRDHYALGFAGRSAIEPLVLRSVAEAGVFNEQSSSNDFNVVGPEGAER
jgi:hypothetical protein